MRMARYSVFVVLVLAATSFAFAGRTKTILPQAMGTIVHIPYLNGTSIWDKGVLVTNCSVSTPTNTQFKRSFIEFPIPNKSVIRATLIITIAPYFSGESSIPGPPTTHINEVSFYVGDSVLDPSDYHAPATMFGSIDVEGVSRGDTFEFDVTDIVRQFEGSSVGFTIKLQG